MAKQDQIRTQLQNKIFTPYGKTVTLYTPASSISYNSRGERDVTTTYTASDIVIVDYDIIDGRKEHEMWGDLQVGDRLAIAAYSETLDVDDYLQINGVNFKINEIEKPSLPDTVVNIFKLSKTTDTIATAPVVATGFIFESGNNFTFESGDNFIFEE